MNKIIYKWHSKLDMPKYDREWHRQDVADELQELKEANGVINKWSELSDVCYTYTRAHWSGHRDIALPISYSSYLIGLVYMFPKFHLRWRFFVILGKKLDKDVKIREVRNPRKVDKLETIAGRYGLDKEAFVSEAKKLMKKRIFLK